MGTRFLLAHETQIHEDYKEKVMKARDIDTQVTGRANGHPIRGLRNPMTKEYLRMEKEGASFEELEVLALGSLRKAVIEGDTKGGSFLAGQIVGMVSKRQSCKEIVEEVVAEANDTINRIHKVYF